jgi:hypothetical protein
MLSVTNNPIMFCHYAECRYAECRHAEYRGAGLNNSNSESF